MHRVAIWCNARRQTAPGPGRVARGTRLARQPAPTNGMARPGRCRAYAGYTRRHPLLGKAWTGARSISRDRAGRHQTTRAILHDGCYCPLCLAGATAPCSRIDSRPTTCCDAIGLDCQGHGFLEYDEADAFTCQRLHAFFSPRSWHGITACAAGGQARWKQRLKRGQTSIMR